LGFAPAKAAFHSSIRFSSRPRSRWANVRGARSVAVRVSAGAVRGGDGRVVVRFGIESASDRERCWVCMSVGSWVSSKSGTRRGDGIRLRRVRPTSVRLPTGPTIIKVRDGLRPLRVSFENNPHGAGHTVSDSSQVLIRFAVPVQPGPSCGCTGTDVPQSVRASAASVTNVPASTRVAG
jgi:hypothetical protein